MTVTIISLLLYSIVMFRHSFNCYLLERLKREDELKSIDKSRWYAINDKCLPEPLLATFHASTHDAGTESFISRCYTKSASFVSLFLYAIARSVLKIFMSSTSVCGLLGCGSMFVFSEEQFRDLVVGPLLEHQKNRRCTSTSSATTGTSSTSSSSDTEESASQTLQLRVSESSAEAESAQRLLSIDPKFGSLLDLGAGDGNVTSMMAPYFSQVYATEVSTFMHSRLRRRGYRLLDPFTWHQEVETATGGGGMDLICLLNVLDRCDQPIRMLADIHRSLRVSDGLLLLAVVFPLYQYVEYKSQHQPEQILPVQGATFEHQVASFHANVLTPAGFELLRWTKLPYLCEGNIDLTYFWLIDAVFLLKTTVPRGK